MTSLAALPIAILLKKKGIMSKRSAYMCNIGSWGKIIRDGGSHAKPV